MRSTPAAADSIAAGIDIQTGADLLRPYGQCITGGINGGPNNFALDSDAAYVYRRTYGAWQPPITYIKADNPAAAQQFGCGIALSKDGATLAVGGCSAVVVPVHVYAFNGVTWSMQAALPLSNVESNDFFGQRISLSDDGNTLAVGAWSEDGSAKGFNETADNSGPGSGAAYLYIRSGNTWDFKSYIKAPNTDDNDLFGYSIAISGDGKTLAIGARGESSAANVINGNQNNNSLSGSGAAYIY